MKGNNAIQYLDQIINAIYDFKVIKRQLLS